MGQIHRRDSCASSFEIFLESCLDLSAFQKWCGFEDWTGIGMTFLWRFGEVTQCINGSSGCDSESCKWGPRPGACQFHLDERWRVNPSFDVTDAR